VRQDELDREIAGMRAGFVAAAAGEATQRTTALAGAIVGTLGDREVVTSPSQNLAVFDEATKGLTADKVSALLKAQFVGSGPLITIPTPTAIEGAEQAVPTPMRRRPRSLSPPRPRRASPTGPTPASAPRARSPRRPRSPTWTPSSCASPTACA
jgi:hypothetical protein